MPQAAEPAEPAADDAAPPPPAVDPAPPAGDLKSEIDAFTTLDACVKAHARLDPLVGDAIEALGYDTLLLDACSVVDAAKSLDPRRCARIEVSSLRERCVATAAEVAGKAEACPWAMADRPLRGRDPACVAVASRDARLCASVVQVSERAACTAVAAGQARACAALDRDAERARCLRLSERWRTVIATGAPRPPFTVAGKMRLEAAAAARGSAIDVDFTAELERGLVVEEQHAGLRLRVGSPSTDGSPAISGGDRLALELLVPAVDPRQSTPPPVRLERADAVIGGRVAVLAAAARSATAASGLAIKVAALEPTRGGRVELTMDGAFGDGPSAPKGHVELRSFVRDVVRPADIYSPRSDSDLPAYETPAAAQVGLDAGLPGL